MRPPDSGTCAEKSPNIKTAWCLFTRFNPFEDTRRVLQRSPLGARSRTRLSGESHYTLGVDNAPN